MKAVRRIRKFLSRRICAYSLTILSFAMADPLRAEEARFESVPLIAVEDVDLHRLIVSFLALANDLNGFAVNNSPPEINYFAVSDRNSIRNGVIKSERLGRIFSPEAREFVESITAESETCQIILINADAQRRGRSSS